jgi:hypothetical protein
VSGRHPRGLDQMTAIAAGGTCLPSSPS